ncbi:MAG: hypothetical protein ACW97Z_01895 [Candidatus Hodarchaeales archaeon]|jgi:hypothetical protein
MKQKHVSMLFLLLFVSFNLYTSSGSCASDVAILEVTKSSSQLLVTLDFDLFAAPTRGETKSLVVFILFSIPLDATTNYVGSMLFFRTNEGSNFLFWMLGDPFSASGIWQMGSENEHFQVDQHQLSMIFIENSEMDDPDLQIISLAKFVDIGSFDQDYVDFQPILNEFQPDVEFLEEFGITSTFLTTTTTTKAKGFPGFLIPLNMGILILFGLKQRKVKNNSSLEK